MEQCTSTKYLWLNLEETYQIKKEKEDIEDHSIKIIKGKESSKTLDCIISICDLENISSEDITKEDPKSISNEDIESPKTLDCNDSKCNDVEFFSSEEDDLEIVCVKFDGSYPMEIIEKYLLELQKEVGEGLYRYKSDHFYTHYNYLSDNTKKFLRRSQRYILKLKGMFKEQEERNKTKLEEKEEDIIRRKNEKEDMKVDDEIKKSFETIIHLKTQIEEAKRVEELLKNQINENEESCDKLEAEIVDLRKKVEKSNKFLNSSKILDEILESQRSPYDKLGLGYKEEDTHVEEITSKKHELSPSKKEDNVANHLHKARKISKEQRKEDIKKLSLEHQRKGMKVFFMVIVIHVMNMVTNILNVENIMEYFITL
jgi:hypothetical protein